MKPPISSFYRGYWINVEETERNVWHVNVQGIDFTSIAAICGENAVKHGRRMVDDKLIVGDVVARVRDLEHHDGIGCELERVIGTTEADVLASIPLVYPFYSKNAVRKALKRAVAEKLLVGDPRSGYFSNER